VRSFSRTSAVQRFRSILLVNITDDLLFFILLKHDRSYEMGSDFPNLSNGIRVLVLRVYLVSQLYKSGKPVGSWPVQFSVRGRDNTSKQLEICLGS
jgi:hypothetical protein